jgi:hypothetical protein
VPTEVPCVQSRDNIPGKPGNPCPGAPVATLEVAGISGAPAGGSVITGATTAEEESVAASASTRLSGRFLVQSVQEEGDGTPLHRRKVSRWQDVVSLNNVSLDDPSGILYPLDFVFLG